MAATTATTLHPELDSTLRRRSISVIEINAPDGRRKTVDLSDLRQDDRTLAEKFGYKPVGLGPYGLSINARTPDADLPR